MGAFWEFGMAYDVESIDGFASIACQVYNEIAMSLQITHSEESTRTVTRLKHHRLDSA